MVSSKRAWWGAALVLCLQAGCFFGKDQLRSQNPSPCHFPCVANQIAQLDRQCHGYHPTCCESWHADCCPCPPPDCGVWPPPPPAELENIEAPAAQPRPARPPAAEPKLEPGTLPPPELDSPTKPPSSPLPESSDTMPVEPRPAPTELPSLIPPGGELRPSSNSGAIRRDERIQRTSALLEKLRKLRQDNLKYAEQAAADQNPTGPDASPAEIPRLAAPEPCSIRLVPTNP
jgi:hypothetical protein